MKKISTITALVLALMMLVSACGDTTPPATSATPSGDAPQVTGAADSVSGDKLEGTGYTITVPAGWTKLSDAKDQFMLSKGTDANNVSSATATLMPGAGAGFENMNEESVKTTLSALGPIEMNSFEDSTLGGKPAKKFVYSMEVSGMTTKTTAYYVASGTDMLYFTVTLVGTAPESDIDEFMNGISIG